MATKDSIKDDQSAEDVLKLLDSLDNVTSSSAPSVSGTTATSGAPATTGGDGKDDDILGFLDSLTNSKPATPANAQSTPISSESKTPVSKETTEPILSTPVQPSNQAQLAPETQEEIHIPDPISSLTSWWSKNKGGLWDQATNAVKQAEAKVRELQSDVDIENIGGSLSKIKFDRQLLQNTLSSVLDTIAPPIGRHEQLQIHVFHDMVGYPAIDNIVHSVFERVMDQVEGGGDLTLVVQKGKERIRRGSKLGRELGIFQGTLEQGQKLAAASIEEYLRSVKAGEATEPEVKQNVETVVDESGNVSTRPITSSRVSNIYLSIQPVSAFSDDTKTTPTHGTTPAPTIISSASPHAFQFIVYLTDPEHNIQFSTVSQSFPLQWAEWLDSADSATVGQDDVDSNSPDPREWVIDWVEEGLGLSVGVVAQTYVSKRMGLNVLPPSRATTPAVKK